MVVDKRSDIIMQAPGQKLPIELKRDTNHGLWEACITQLERLYVRDPEAQGYGIFGVFWFGDKRAGNIATVQGQVMARNPPDLVQPDIESMLDALDQEFAQIGAGKVSQGHPDCCEVEPGKIHSGER